MRGRAARALAGTDNMPAAAAPVHGPTAMSVRSAPVTAVAVGTGLAAGPPHRSQRAELPHWAPASGQTRHAHQEGMHHPGFFAPLRAHDPALVTHQFRLCVRDVFHRPCFPWPVPFPPPPPQPQPCSAGSQVLRDRPTSHARSSQAYRHWRSLSGPPGDHPTGEQWDLPVLALGGSVHAMVLRPRGAGQRLA